MSALKESLVWLNDRKAKLFSSCHVCHLVPITLKPALQFLRARPIVLDVLTSESQWSPRPTSIVF